ncbi:glycosyltransferase family 4 protein [Natrinema halophilum]|nr:glycosyltransferase family 4 protein [Natrinema halophilum]
MKAICERLADRGHDVTVVTADAADGIPSRETRNGVEVVRHRGFDPGGAFHIAPGILRTLRRIDGDIMHGHNYHSLPLFFAAISAQETPFVATPHYHGGSGSSFRDRLLSLYRPVGGWALRNADAVVAVSDWEREQLAADFGAETTVIPNGIEVDRFRQSDPKEHPRPYLVTVGRLKEYKGVQHVIRALSELPEFDLLVAGTGPYRDELERIAEREAVRDRVTFLGYVDDDEIPGLYAGAATYVTLSSFEAYGITVAESLAAGTPCVVRERGALANWIHRADCVSVSNVSPPTVARAVRDVVDRETDPTTLPTWDDAVDALEEQYRAQSTSL